MELHSLTDTYTLNNGVEIPVIGFGTWQTPSGEVARESVEAALEADTVTLILQQLTAMKKVLAKQLNVAALTAMNYL